ncbi:GNAT family N-acetyltransferase [Oscillatoriales cyanobacterium LEGE 11467]|uniref:GNAT family N-acetyltransferase n=1 Tax=Zarconia navalis LEGE 11467 TaxID=1828826 RepID=A0A928VYE5_9CYAN|nr:GNAT family N-acetyltransferase [Zarconia navalis]MBE9041087.1 GNAT family N-acetyltransferase [Zarconia navalis LEGE 11467]
MDKIQTSRLILRRWQESDRAPFAQLNADPRVMEYMPGLLSADENNDLVDRIENDFRDRGFGWFAVELASTQTFIGFIGLSVPRFEASFTPCVEIGWRLAFDYWGNGYATEGAASVLNYGFTQLQLPQVVSFTVPANRRSRRVMERIGLEFVGTFNHPVLPPGHPLEQHFLYAGSAPSPV